MSDAVMLGAMAVGVVLIIAIVLRSQRRTPKPPPDAPAAPATPVASRSLSLIGSLIALVAGASILYWQYQFGFPDVFSTAIGALVVIGGLIGLFR